MRFLQIIGGWINRYFSNEEAIYLVTLIVLTFVVLFSLGTVLAPVLTGLVIAFLLQGLVKFLRRQHVPELLAVITTFVIFLGVMVALLGFLVPLVWRQLKALVEGTPQILGRLQELAIDLSVRFPGFFTEKQVDTVLGSISSELGNFGRTVLETAVGQLPSLVSGLIYLILVPISIFFFLKDRDRMLAWFQSLLPENRPLLDRVGAEMVINLGNYVRGKFAEILIVGSVTFVTFTILGLNYSALLAVLVGISVLVPFVGAAVATLPVLLVGLMQLGWSWELAYIMAAYGVIQALDGNILVPVLFSEVVNLHPIAIIIAVLAFGGLWGIWGVFFAIPLATLVKAILGAWPHQTEVTSHS